MAEYCGERGTVVEFSFQQAFDGRLSCSSEWTCGPGQVFAVAGVTRTAPVEKEACSGGNTSAFSPEILRAWSPAASVPRGTLLCLEA